MRAFTCSARRQLVTFESIECLQRGSSLGFEWEARAIGASAPGTGCLSRELIGCNGLAEG